jgi:acyl carrier protein
MSRGGYPYSIGRQSAAKPVECNRQRDKEKGKMAQSREEVVDTMREVLASELGVDADKITADARFKEDLDADSLDLVEVVLALEEKFGIEIPDDEIAGVKTVGEAADLVISKQTAVG